MEKHDDVYDTSLALGLGSNQRSGLPTNRHCKRNRSIKPEPLASNPSPLGPSLTLGLPSDADQSTPVEACVKASPEASLARSSSYSASSFSKVMSGETEKVSSRVSDEDDDGNARKKLRLTKAQSALLEDRFKEHSTLNPKQKQALAKQLNLRPRQVEVWFQNRRARTKMKQTEVDCEFLKRCCNTLTDENRRLQKELRELKAVKLASPWCMQFPGTNLMVCPRCERVIGAFDRSKDGPLPLVATPKPRLFNNTFTNPAAC